MDSKSGIAVVAALCLGFAGIKKLVSGPEEVDLGK